MTRIHPLALAFVIATHKSIDLIDVRPRAQFKRAHIRDARSIPLPRLRAAKIMRERGYANSNPLFLICDGRTRAGLAAGMLRGAGCLHPVVVEGGMELWEAQGLPAVRRWHFRAFKRCAAIVRAGLVAFVAGCREIRGRVGRPFMQRQANKAWWCRDEFQPREG